MANYKLKAEITADASGYEAGVKKAEKASKKLSTSVSKVIQGLGKNGLVGALGAVGLASQGLTSTLGAVVKIARKVSETVNECTNAYKNQLIAERELDTAIQNNPFVTGASADALKQFASEMQKVSNYGDEELIPMMANLVSLGRTEAETMQIMSVAMDMSAGMGISLDTAITQLNATLNGNIGRLGQQNAELKDLTEVELRSGKAIEILGEKFKGLSGATADTSKQLQNMKGDFKEALGQFTLPSSDMWNKFWAGFYEKGIEVIKQFNEFLDVNIIGKMMLSNFEAYAKTLKSEKDKGENIQSYLWTISDDELNAMDKYLEKQKSLNETQKLIYERTQKEVERRKFLAELRAEEEAIEAENAKKKADAEAKAKAEAEKQAEIAKKKTDWESKLLDQRIEMLETERDRAIGYAEEAGEETYSIGRDYNEKILELKLERLEKEKEKALAEEGLTAEDKVAIEEYYSGETKKIYNDLGNYKKKKKKEEEKDEKSKFAIMVEYAKQYAQNVAKVFSKIANTVKNVFSAVGNIFKGALNIFAFNPDDALVSLLKIEDTILTFFVETLPKLPQFFASAIQSVVVLLNNLLSNINWDMVNELINSIVDVVIKNAPSIINNLLSVVINIAQSLLDGIINFVESGGWRMILDVLLKIQKRLEKFITDNIDEIVNTIIGMLPDFIQFLIDSVVSASKTLTKLMKPIMKLITALIDNIVDFLFSDEIFEASIEVTISFIEAMAEELLPRIAYLIPKIITKIIGFVVKNLPKLVKGIINGLIQGFVKTNWIEVIKQCFMGFIDGFKDLFGIHSPSTLFEGFGLNIVEGLVNGLKGISEAVMIILQPFADMVTSLFSSMFGSLENIVNISFGGIVATVEVINRGVSLVISSLSDGLASINNSFANIINSVANLIKQIVKLIEKINEATNSLNPFKGGSSGNGGSSGGSYPGQGTVFDPDPRSNPLTRRLFGHAIGTNNAQKGLALVGEAGPELVKFNGGEQVLNNRNTNKALAEMGGNTNNFNVTFNNLQDTTAFSMMQQLKAYNRQMAINGII